MARRPTLMGIFAHPDDESFGAGGTLARYASGDGDVHVIIATDGIAGSVEDPSHLQDHDTLAQVRSTELANAAIALQLTSIWSLPYRDSGMRGSEDNEHPGALIQQPLEHLIAEILEYMQRLRPDVVITHEPYGGYGHPDHIRVCEATTAAFYLANADGGLGPNKLYYRAYDKTLSKLVTRLMPLFGQDPSALGRNGDINMVESSSWPAPIHANIDVSAYMAIKERASRAHASQYGGGPAFLRILPSALRRRYTHNESFIRAYPAPTNHVETDLFSALGQSNELTLRA